MVERSNNGFAPPDVGKLFLKGSGFVTENTGNIKDFYKISSCIGRGKSIYSTDLFFKAFCKSKDGNYNN